MRIVFMGTGEIAVPAFRQLVGCGHRPSLLVTQPDRPAGRHMRPLPPAVKVAAIELGVPVYQPESMKEAAACDRIEAECADVIVVMAYGQYLPRRLLEMPRIACINLHASLLPRHRGAACIQGAIDAGDAETGVTVMHVAPKMDSGDIILMRAIPIGPADTAGAIHDRLAELAPGVLGEALAVLAAGTAPRVPQEEAAVTYIGKLGREDGRIDWAWPAERIERRIRAFEPWPGTFTTVDAGQGPKRLKVFPQTLVEEVAGESGVVLGADDDGLLIACGEGGLRLVEVQPDGSRRMNAGAFVRGARIEIGMRLGGGD